MAQRRILSVWASGLLIMAPLTQCLQSTAWDAPVKTVQLPVGSRPEGITAGSHNDLWVACLSGAVVHVDLDTSTSTVVHREPGVALSGAKFCHQQQILFAAGSLSGKGYLFYMQQTNSSADAKPAYSVLKREIIQLSPIPGLSYINDVALSNDRAYFTDSFHSVLRSIPRFAAPLGGSKKPVVLHPTGTHFDTKLGQFRANGIAVYDSTAKVDTLLVANTHTGNMYSVRVEKPALAAAPQDQQQQHQQQTADQTGVSSEHATPPQSIKAAAAGISQNTTKNTTKQFVLNFGPAAVDIDIYTAGDASTPSHVGTPAALQQDQWPMPAVTEYVLPSLKGKASDRLLLDGVWVLNKSMVFVADNYNNRVWGLSVEGNLSNVTISCLVQSAAFGVPTTLTTKQGMLWLANAHLDTCFPFLPCPKHKFEALGINPGDCKPWS